MLVKNFLLLSALAVAVVSAADKQTSLRHEEAGRGLKKDNNNNNKKKKNNNNKGNNGEDGNEFQVAFSKFSACTPQAATRLPDFTNSPNGGSTNLRTRGYIPGFGTTLAGGQFSLGSCDLIPVREGEGDEGTTEVNRADMNEACVNDPNEKCCLLHSNCDSGCCAGWSGCVPEGTAAYTKLCGQR